MRSITDGADKPDLLADLGQRQRQWSCSSSRMLAVDVVEIELLIA